MHLQNLLSFPIEIFMNGNEPHIRRNQLKVAILRWIVMISMLVIVLLSHTLMDSYHTCKSVSANRCMLLQTGAAEPGAKGTYPSSSPTCMNNFSIQSSLFTPIVPLFYFVFENETYCNIYRMFFFFCRLQNLGSFYLLFFFFLRQSGCKLTKVAQ